MSNNDTALQFGENATVERSYNGISWARVKRVKSYGVPDPTFDKRQVTDLDGPKGWHTFVKGFGTLGSAEFTCNYTREAYVEALADVEKKEGVQYRIVLENGDKFGFTALVSVSPQFELEGELVFKMTLEGSGSLWFTEGGA